MPTVWRSPATAGAIAWCGVFAAAHVFWGLGGDAGLASSAGAALARQRPLPFVLFGLWGVAVLLLAGAALVGWSTSATLPRRARALCAASIVGVGLLLLARAVLVELVLAANAGGVRDTVGPAEARWSLLLWNPWFALGAAFFLAVGFRLARRASGRDDAPASS
ncbi:MAG TPA: DUF3995 domain-containing protein [Actinocatenispora sp.]